VIAPARGPIEIGARRTTYRVGLFMSIVAFAVTAGWVVPNLGLFPPVVALVAMTLVGAVTFAYLLATGPYVFRLDATGVHDRSGVLQAGKLAWEEIEKASVVVATGRAQIGLGRRRARGRGRRRRRRIDGLRLGNELDLGGQTNLVRGSEPRELGLHVHLPQEARQLARDEAEELLLALRSIRHHRGDDLARELRLLHGSLDRVLAEEIRAEPEREELARELGEPGARLVGTIVGEVAQG